MYQENIIDMLMRKMIHFNQNDPQRIHHLIKVHSFAQMICRHYCGSWDYNCCDFTSEKGNGLR